MNHIWEDRWRGGGVLVSTLCRRIFSFINMTIKDIKIPQVYSRPVVRANIIFLLFYINVHLLSARCSGQHYKRINFIFITVGDKYQCRKSYNTRGRHNNLMKPNS
jgi:hypothetical protein